MTTLSRLYILLLLTQGTSAVGQVDPRTASVSGQVLDPLSQGVPYASVKLAMRRSFTSNPITVTGNAGADGSFTFANLAGGTYESCAGSDEFALLDTCSWVVSPPTITVLPGQKLSGVQIKPSKGVVIKVRIDDPVQALKNKEASAPDYFFIFGVPLPSGILLPPRFLTSDATGRDYRLLIPTATSVNLTVHTKHFTVNDSLGTLLSPAIASKPISEAVPPLIIPIAATLVPTVVKLTVTGLK